ncbi:hypothetical protein [Pseudomonas sp. CGJS7]|uniref:hypothetical protein n=1 Tax=Pseudomonas sp. CGJS7 TaxID=3109348 RepID=UPI003008AAA0
MLRKSATVCLSVCLLMLAGCEMPPRFMPLSADQALPHVDLRDTLPAAQAPV